MFAVLYSRLRSRGVRPSYTHSFSRRNHMTRFTRCLGVGPGIITAVTITRLTFFLILRRMPDIATIKQTEQIDSKLIECWTKSCWRALGLRKRAPTKRHRTYIINRANQWMVHVFRGHIDLILSHTLLRNGPALVPSFYTACRSVHPPSGRNVGSTRRHASALRGNMEGWSLISAVTLPA